MVHGLPKIDHPKKLCEGCLVMKQTRNSYPTQTNYKAGKRLERVYGDLCGPISPPMPSGNLYFLLLVDDHSRIMWVFMIKTKDEAFSVLKNFCIFVENETCEKIKVFRTDRGGEFLSNQFTTYYDETGLNRHFIAPYYPQQNGFVERRNRTVIEMARSILKGMLVPRNLWGEAVRHVVYVLNRVSTKALKDKTPYEACSRRKPHLEHLIVFGCIDHTRVANGHLRKLDNRSMKLVHLGCEPGSKAYQLLDPYIGKVYVSRDVKFEENKWWSWDETVKYQTSTVSTFVLEGYNPLSHNSESASQPSTPLHTKSESVAKDSIQSPSHEQHPSINTPESLSTPMESDTIVDSTTSLTNSTRRDDPKKVSFVN